MSSPAQPRSGPDLSISFCGLSFKNPIIAASGTFGYGVEFEDIVALDKLGGFVVKGLSREPMAGFALPAVQVSSVPGHACAPGIAPEGAIEITDSFGHRGSWLGGRHRVLFVKSPAGLPSMC